MANKDQQGASGCCSFKQLPELDDEVVSRMSEYMGSPLRLKEENNDVHALLALCLTYVFIIFPRVAFSAIQSNMKDELGFQNSDISDLLVIQGVSYALGKLFNGMIIDCMDARYVLYFFMIMSVLSTFGWSFMNDKASMFPWIFVNMYCQAGTWPCMAKLIYNWFDANAYTQTFSFLSMASKAGSFFTLLLLGVVVSATEWRWTLRVASFVLALGVVFAVLMMRNRPAPPVREDHRPMSGKDEGGQGCGALCGMIHKSARFWLCLAAISTMTVLVGMENYMALWLTDVFRPCTDTDGDNCDSVFDSGNAAIISSLLPLGLIISLVYGQFYLLDVHPKKEAKVSVLFLVGATLLIVVFAVWTTLVESGTRPKEDPWTWIGVLSVFILLYGFCVGYPYYIPVAVYSVKVGGTNAATLSSLLDLGGFVLLTLFAYFGTAISESDGVSETSLSTWRYNLYCVVVISILATISLFGFQFFNLKSMKNKSLRKSVLSFIGTGSSNVQLGGKVVPAGDPDVIETEI